MRFQCTTCFSVVSIDDSEAGQAVACGQCGNVILVPRHPTGTGAVIGDFVIEKEIAQGGLATVYLAHQISLDRPAALKILHDQHASNPDYIANFISEARSAAQLNHPNIVQAYAVGEDGGFHYFAMELIQGTTLKSLLAHSGRLVVERALGITMEICKALDFAWTNKQLVHRDIKPDNIIVTENGEVKLADLGLAKLGNDFLRKAEDEVFGTPQYISPELLLGESADNRSDIYSLGATLYHSLTGQFPYTGNSAGELAGKHISDRLRPPESVIPDIPSPVSDIIEIMMAKRPGQRYQSAAEVMQEIERYHAGSPLTRKPQPDFQNPINFDEFEKDLAATYIPDETARGGKAAGNGSKLKSSKLSGTKSGATKFRTGKKRSLKAGATKFKTGNSSSGTGQTQPEKTELSQAASSQEQADGQSISKSSPPRSARQKKKSGTGPFIAAMALVLLLGIGAVAAVIIFYAVKQPAQDDERFTAEQQKAIADLVIMVRQGSYYTSILESARDILAEYPRDEAFRSEVQRILGPQIEQELREKRQEIHAEVLAGWRRESRRIQEEREAADQQARREALQREREAQRLLEEQQRREERERQIAEMTERQKQLRRQSLLLCRQHQFEEAKLILAEMVSSRFEQFREWGEMSQQTITFAQESFELVRSSRDLLEGINIRVRGHARRARIESIGVRNINAAFRENRYERGVFVREAVEPVTVRLDTLPGSTLARLMEAAWERQGNDPESQDLQLKIGAYLLATGRNLGNAAQRLNNAGKPSVTQPMLAELDEVRIMLGDNQED